MAADESNDLKVRVEAWRHFGRRELNDCRKFHLRIREGRWHGENAILQPTWAKLLLTLHAYAATEAENRLNYQRHEWGCQSGRACVIELSGLAANNLQVRRDRDSFLGKRIGHLHERMLQYKPKFVILYGRTKGCKKALQDFGSDSEAIPDTSFDFAELRRCGPTILAWTRRHPVAFGSTNRDWIDLGAKLRSLTSKSQERAPAFFRYCFSGSVCERSQSTTPPSTDSRPGSPPNFPLALFAGSRACGRSGVRAGLRCEV
jgi:hypothetical protein